jgi:hypothetical protein
MHRFRNSFVLALVALVLLASVTAAQSQQVPQDLVTFKATIGGPLLPGFTIPTEPPMVSDDQTTSGQASEIGQVTFFEHSVAHLGPEGRAVFVSNGIGALVAANGDAIFLKFSGLVRPTGAEFGYTVTGGRGRFSGATGSGTILCVRNREKMEQSRTFEGVISRPRQ